MDHKYLLDGFTDGFRLGCLVPPKANIAKNHKSVYDHPEVIKKHITKGIALGRIAGPFTKPPLENFISSPLGIVPKSEPGKYRIIHDLSYPKNASVNTGVPRENAEVHYDSIDTIVDLVYRHGRGCLMAKTDIEDAFRIIPIHPLDHSLLGFSFEGEFYFDRCLPMGASSSCQIFEQFSMALQWILQSKCKAGDMSHILDDLFFIGPPNSEKCRDDLTRFLYVCKKIGVPIKMEKSKFQLQKLLFMVLK